MTTPTPLGRPLAALSDDELQTRIADFSRRMLEAQTRYDTSGEVADRVERDSCWIAERAALKERSRRKSVIAAMERERGLSPTPGQTS